MDIASVLFKTADLVLKVLGSPIVNKIQSIRIYETEIKMLVDTVDLIGDVLSDVQGRHFQEASLNKGYKRLREAFIDAQDFLDRIKALKKKREVDDSKFKKARRFFSKSNPGKYAVEVHNSIKEIKKNLDAIAQDLQKFGLKEPCITPKATRTTARATGSNVDAVNIIGRDEDKSKVVELLLASSDDQREIRGVSIVGMGGLGKTTLAQLVFNDERWQGGKFDLKLWASDCKQFKAEWLLKKLLLSISGNTNLNHDDGDHLRNQFVEKIRGKKFLLVLDDVEDVDANIWEKMLVLLNNGNNEESRILATTRSTVDAMVIGSAGSIYQLKGLLDKDAVKLFESCAFSRKRRDEDLVEIGKHIVNKCARVPLALKVMGSYLRDKDKRSWERVKGHGLPTDDNAINCILKISYDGLHSTLKQCFSFCALFPKNYRISKEILTNIWMANVRFKTNQNETLEEVCNDNLEILCERFFLEKSTSSYWDDIAYFRMHDLMHDLATEVAAAEMLVVDCNAKVDSDKLILEDGVRHLSLSHNVMKDHGILIFEPNGQRLRTFLQFYPVWYNRHNELYSVDKMVSNCLALRVLDLRRSSIHKLTNSIRKLIQLRYLDLSSNEFQTLPDSITELINLRHLSLVDCKALIHMPNRMGALTSLEVLSIAGCEKLKELPVDIEKMISLRHLKLAWCRALTHMPCGIGALVFLQVFDISWCGKLEELPMGIEKLINLRHLNLAGCKALTCMPFEMGALTSLEVLDVSYCEKLEELPFGIEKLISLRNLNLAGCKALIRMPSTLGTLTLLELLDISYCGKLVELPMGIEKLINLRHLNFAGCKALTCIPSGMGALTSLQVLDIAGCEKLKELPTGIGNLIQLRHLKLDWCWALTEMPTGIVAMYAIGSPPRFMVGYPESNDIARNQGLIIELPINMELKAQRDGEAYLLNKRGLMRLEIKWRANWTSSSHFLGIPKNHVDILAKLQPPPNLEEFTLHGYQGMMFPPWMPEGGFVSVLPNLVGICISNCGNFQNLPPLSKLPFLRSLTLSGLSSLKYIEEANNVSAATFCPSLDELWLQNLPELKGWCRGVASGEKSLFPAGLNSLRIDSCPDLTAAPPFSFVEAFYSAPISSMSLFLEACRNGGSFRLDMQKENDEYFLGLKISDNNVAESSTTIYMAEAFREMSGHLAQLKISNFSGLKTLPGLQHLTALQKLKISKCCDFTADEDDEDNQTMKGLKSLTNLTLKDLPNMVKLPEGIQFLNSLKKLTLKNLPQMVVPDGIQFLTSLTKLSLSNIPKLETLPEGIQLFTSLQQVNIYKCANLMVPEWLHSTGKYNEDTWEDGFYFRKKRVDECSNSTWTEST